MKYVDFGVEDFVKDEYFQKWVLNPDEMTCDFWEGWLNKNPDKKKMVRNASEFVRLLNAELESDGLSTEDFNDIWSGVVEKRNSGVTDVNNYSSNLLGNFRKKSLSVAAIFIGSFAVLGGAFFLGFFDTVDVSGSTKSQIVLELEDGARKILDEANTYTIENSKGEKVGFQSQNILSYEKSSIGEKKALAYNTLSVPYGKKFELILSDGTHVFLNSGSQLRYPINFLEDSPRTVFLDGEAFFSVKEDKENPFTVVTDRLNTKVYGTKFNVSSYKDENNTFTVLVEGSVGLYKANNVDGQKPIMVKPGQRGVLEGGIISVEKVNINKYVSWTRGELYFVNDTFELLIKELERHYNVTFENRYEQLNQKRFTGTFTTETLDQVLRVCSEHTPFQYNYDLANNTIVIEK